MIFKVGDKVKKVTGDSHPTGVIVGTAVTKAGKDRFLVELDAIEGMLHVYSPENLELIEDKPVKPKQMELEGGDWYVSLDFGAIEYNKSSDISRRNGIERKTEELAIKAYEQVIQYSRLLAFAHEIGGDYEFIMENSNYYIYYDLVTKNYQISIDVYVNDISKVYMSSETAQIICEKLNSGEIVL